MPNKYEKPTILEQRAIDVENAELVIDRIHSIKIPMNIKEIIIQYLKDKGYDGLCNWRDCCSCVIGDLIPCSQVDANNCFAGVKVPCDGSCEDGKCDYHIVERKP